MDKTKLTQFGRAMMQDLGIDMIPGVFARSAGGAPSGPSAPTRAVWCGSWPLAGITDLLGANRYLAEVYIPAFNAEFRRSPAEDKSAFVPMAEIGASR